MSGVRKAAQHPGAAQIAPMNGDHAPAKSGAGEIRTPVPIQSASRVYACSPSIDLGLMDCGGQHSISP